MTITPKDLDKIAKLAYISTDEEHSPQLAQEINSIMDFVDELRSVDTKGNAPLYHPFDLHQTLRPDEVTEADCVEQLAEIAPLFEDNYYLVPKVIEPGK